ncbi:MAG: 3-dehydroquinate synthase [Clostridia bacterium]|nr:3-dehydroquinate synthase [Clostridia bacterium]
MILSVKTALSSYPIVLERGVLARAAEHLRLDRRCLILTDENIPREYIDTLSSQCREPKVFVIPAGESSKTLEMLGKVIETMLEAEFSRSDCVVALGGGVVGDLAGFVAASFQRGIDFYNVPTTVLSQVDSSIGGKVAVNFKGWKNMVGAFYPPKAVLIDPETLRSLPRRQIANGLAESVKMAMTFDGELFSLFERGEGEEKIDEVIEKSLRIKKFVVEEDERESGLRKVLNFGHTLAHAIESESHKSADFLYHGECVAVGMVPMCTPEVRARLIPVLEQLGLPTTVPFSGECLVEALRHDKKISGTDITLILVDRIGTYRMEKMPVSAFAEKVKEDFQ